MSEGNGFVTRAALLEATKRPRDIKEVEIAGLGKVRIRRLRELERSRIEAPNLTKKAELNVEKAKDTKLRTICEALVDESGEPIVHYSDIDQLRNMEASLVSDLYAAIADHSGVSKDEVGRAEKNLGETAGDSSQ